MSVNEVKLKRADRDFDVKGTESEFSRTFCIGNEDHTLGNALRHVLMQHQGVNFAGYSVPHPSDPVVQIRVQTASNIGDDGALTATDALIEAAQTLGNVCDVMLQQLETSLPEVAEDSKQRESILLDLEQDREDDYPMEEEEEEEEDEA